MRTPDESTPSLESAGAQQLVDRLDLAGARAHAHYGAHLAALDQRGRLEKLRAQEPKLLLLDEPAAGLSAVERGMMRDLVRDLPDDMTVLLIEHDMELALGLADYVTCLHNGSQVAQGNPEEIKNNERVQDIYLGRGD